MYVGSAVTRFGHLRGGGQACLQEWNSKRRELDEWSINDWQSDLGTPFVKVFLSEVRRA